MKPAPFVVYEFPFVGRCDRCRRCTDLRYCQRPHEVTWEPIRGFICAECINHYVLMEKRGTEMVLCGVPVRVVNDGLGGRFVRWSKFQVKS